MRRVLIVAAAWLSLANAFAHDLITAGSAQTWLAELDEWQTPRLTSADNALKGEAAYRTGVVLETIRGLLNQDLMAHGEVSGLQSQYLIAALKTRGLAPAISASRRQYLSQAAYFREALRLSPKAPFAADAAFRLLDGLFQDNLGDDPLGSALVPALNAEMLRLAEHLAALRPVHPRREEIDFIGAILYTRAGRDCGRDTGAAGFAQKARIAIDEFGRRYPGSLRAAAMPVLREALADC